MLELCVVYVSSLAAALQCCWRAGALAQWHSSGGTVAMAPQMYLLA